MPNRNIPDQEPQPKRQFMREKVVKPPMSRKQIAMRLCSLALIAAVGGIAAGVSFAVARPLAEKYLAPEETLESIPVTIPKDEPEIPSQTVSEETSGIESEAVVESETPETTPVEEVVESALENHEYSVKDLSSMYASLKEVVTGLEGGIVAVHSVKQETDWFDNPVETSGVYAGAVIASTHREFLILTTDDVMEDADSIRVTFDSNAEVAGKVKRSDPLSGLAIVSVDKFTMRQEARDRVNVVELGNSYSVKQGDVVIAAGAPAGFVGSSTYGNISYVMSNVQSVDGNTRILYADLNANTEAGTFLLNLSGQIIGWVTDEYHNERNSNMTAALAISNYKGILEKMSNGISIPYLGVRGQDTTAETADAGMPLGMYVAECIVDGPAYNVGIQNGDIITQLDGKNVLTIRDYQNILELLKAGDEVKVVVQRKSIDEYKELEYQVIVGAR